MSKMYIEASFKSILEGGMFGEEGAGSIWTYVDCCFVEDIVDTANVELLCTSGMTPNPNEGNRGSTKAPFILWASTAPSTNKLGFNPEPPLTGMMYALGAAIGSDMSPAFNGTLGYQSTSCSSAIFSI